MASEGRLKPITRKLEPRAKKSKSVTLKTKLQQEKDDLYNKYPTAHRTSSPRIPATLPKLPKPLNNHIVYTWLEYGSSKQDYCDTLPQLPTKSLTAEPPHRNKTQTSELSLPDIKHSRGLVASEKKIRDHKSLPRDWICDWLLEKVMPIDMQHEFESDGRKKWLIDQIDTQISIYERYHQGTKIRRRQQLNKKLSGHNSSIYEGPLMHELVKQYREDLEQKHT